MRTFLGAVSVFFTILFSTVSAGAQVCSCTEVENVFDFVTVDDSDLDYMENYLWRYEYSEVAYDLTVEGEPTFCRVYVSLVGEDDPDLDSYVMEEDGNEKILVGRTWIRFDQFEAKLRAGCQFPAT